MNPSAVRFNLVGYRFIRLLIDEEPFESIGRDKFEAEISISVGDPKVSVEKYEKRQVIEMDLELSMEVSKQSNTENSQMLINAVCRAGFIAGDENYDGDLSAFAVSAPDFSRALYWTVRQRVSSILTMTKLRVVRLPWDLDEKAKQQS